MLIGLLLPGLTFSYSACATLPRHVPAETQSSLNPPGVKSTVQLNINVASADQLEKLPGVGKVIAERIVRHRAEYGPFRRVEHLMMVRGISDKKFREIWSMIMVE